MTQADDHKILGVGVLRHDGVHRERMGVVMQLNGEPQSWENCMEGVLEIIIGMEENPLMGTVNKCKAWKLGWFLFNLNGV